MSKFPNFHLHVTTAAATCQTSLPGYLQVTLKGAQSNDKCSKLRRVTSTERRSCVHYLHTLMPKTHDGIQSAFRSKLWQKWLHDVPKRNDEG
jgi:hypothetical protein